MARSYQLPETNWRIDLRLVLLLGCCPLIGSNPGWLQALTGHKALKSHLYIMGLTDSPLCRLCRAEEKTSAYVLCKCEGLATHRHTYLGSFFFDPKDVRYHNICEWSGTLLYSQGSHDWFQLKWHKGHVKKAYMQWDQKGPYPLSIHSFIQIQELLSMQNENTIIHFAYWRWTEVLDKVLVNCFNPLVPKWLQFVCLVWLKCPKSYRDVAKIMQSNSSHLNSQLWQNTCCI